MAVARTAAQSMPLLRTQEHGTLPHKSLGAEILIPRDIRECSQLLPAVAATHLILWGLHASSQVGRRRLQGVGASDPIRGEGVLQERLGHQSNQAPGIQILPEHFPVLRQCQQCLGGEPSLLICMGKLLVSGTASYECPSAQPPMQVRVKSNPMQHSTPAGPVLWHSFACSLGVALVIAYIVQERRSSHFTCSGCPGACQAFQVQDTCRPPTRAECATKAHEGARGTILGHGCDEQHKQ